MHPHFEQRQESYISFTTQDLSFFAHFHPQTELVQVLQGECLITAGQHQAVLQEGDVAVIFPGTIHSYLTDGESLLFIVIYRPDLVIEYAKPLTSLRPTCPFVRKDKLHPDAVLALSRLREAEERPCSAASPTEAEEHSIGSTLRRVYLALATGCLLTGLTLEKSPQNQNDDLLHRLLVYMEEHFQEPLSLETIASDLGISRFHLSRCFNRQIGIGFHNYLGTLRAGRARSLLADTSRSITDICYESGFESMNTFYRAFKSYFGVTPGEYRNDPNGKSPF